jgi:serine protease inhibitor
MLKSFFLIFIFLVTDIFPMEQLREKSKVDMPTVIENFGFSLFNILDNNKQNTIFSPFSITSSLLILSYGSEGSTKDEILNALKINKDHLINFNRLNTDISIQKKPCKILLSNLLFIDIFSPIYKSFENEIDSKINTKIIKGTFVKNKNKQINLINDYFTKRTNYNINNFILPNDISDNTKLLSLSTLFIKGIWSFPFNLSESEPNIFNDSFGNKVTIYKMRQIAKFLYFEDENLKTLALPLDCKNTNSNINLLIILPNTKINKKPFNRKSFNQLISKLSYKELDIRIPRFNLKRKYLLKSALRKLSINRAFTRRADFSNINGRLDLYLNNMIHDSILKVDENGINVKDEDVKTAEYKIKSNTNAHIFDVNKPFYVVICDLKSKTILLIGKVLTPNTNI